MLPDQVIPKKGKRDESNISELLDEKLGGIKDFFNDKFDSLLQTTEANSKKIKKAELELSTHKRKFTEIDHRMNSIEQQKLNAKMEISGLLIPDECDNISLKSLVTSYLSDSNIEFHVLEIADVYSIRKRQKHKTTKCIIVEFLHQAIKNRVMREKMAIDKNKKKIDVYFNHVLTTANYSMLMRAKEAVRDKLFNKAWSMSGDIFITKANETNKIKLYDHDHLTQLIETAKAPSIPPVTLPPSTEPGTSASFAKIMSATSDDDDDDGNE